MVARVLLPAVLVGLLCAQGAAGQIDPHLVGWWRFDEGGGNTAVDSSGRGNHGTLMGGPQWVAGWDGLALDFNGQGQYVETGKVPSELGVGGRAPRTIALWVYARRFDRGGVYEMGGHRSAGHGFCLRTETNENRWRLVYGTWETAFGAESLDEWVHITHSNDSYYAEVHVNGEWIMGRWRRPDTPDDLTFRIGVCEGVFFDGSIDDVRLYDRALESDEIARIMEGDPARAWGACPAYRSYPSVDLARSLRWSAGTGAIEHDVYFGVDEAAVRDASIGTEGVYRGRQGGAATTYLLSEPGLEWNTTYYWRIDEIDSSGTICKGAVWRFTVDDSLVGWWKLDEGEGTVAVDSSGRGNQGRLMGDPQWVAGYDGLALDFDGEGDYVETGRLPSEFGVDGNAPRTVALWVYARRFNGGGVYGMGGDGHREGFALGTGTDENRWRMAYGTEETSFAVESAQEWVHFAHVNEAYDPLLYANGEEIARFWYELRTTDDRTFQIGVWKDAHFDGLIDDVRLYSRAVGEDEIAQIMQGDPARAWAPQPGHGSFLTLDEAGALAWSAGTGARGHNVYLGTYQAAVREATPETEGVYRGRQALAATSYIAPEAPLDWGQRYYWRVDEIDGEGAVHPGGLWRFTTLDYLIVDDFESYNDEDNMLWDTWEDGWFNGTGSTVGYFEAPYVDITIVHGGRQSMPFFYDNTDSPWYSEASRTWEAPADWTRFGVDTLTLYLVGTPVAFAELADGGIVMGGFGPSQWQTGDVFRFAYKELDGDGSIVVRVDGLSDTGPWDQAGVMIREAVRGEAKHVGMLVTTGHGISFQYRLADDGPLERVTREGPRAPYWVRITRTGDTFTASCSADGVVWSGATDDPGGSSVEIPMRANVWVGLAVSADAGRPATYAEFSGLSVSGEVKGSWGVEGTGGSQSRGNDPARLYVGLVDEAGNVGVVSHPDDPLAVGAAVWERWDIALSEFAAAGVDLTRITEMLIGVGDRDNPVPGGEGMVHFDDIRLTRAEGVEDPNAVDQAEMAQRGLRVGPRI